jgi:outer membrane protein OmpA-like peptidoglycan-associated protein
MISKLPFFSLMVVILFLAACSSNNMVVLVPDPDGTVGDIMVSNSAGRVEMNAPNRVTFIKDENTTPSAPADIKEEEIRALFSEALASQPPQPIHFVLYFEKDAPRLISDSINLIDGIIAAIRERVSSHISVIGHTDTLGDKLYNQKLSMLRAAAVRDLLIQKGIPEDHIETTSHGEKNLLIKTGDNVEEPKNRRVEVVVR